MSFANFSASLAAVLKHEGGYNNDPHDPGGPTNKGITQAVYDDWRHGHGLPEQSVKLIVRIEVEAIYKGRFWDAVSGDELPPGIDYATFDFAVNSGVSRAIRYLQRAVGVNDDGMIGPVTLAAVARMSADAVIDAVCDLRLAFLRHLPTFTRFGNGWTHRVADVRILAKAMAA